MLEPALEPVLAQLIHDAVCKIEFLCNSKLSRCIIDTAGSLCCGWVWVCCHLFLFPVQCISFAMLVKQGIGNSMHLSIVFVISDTGVVESLHFFVHFSP